MASRSNRRRDSVGFEPLEGRRLFSTFVLNGTSGTDIWHLETYADGRVYRGSTLLSSNPANTDVQVNGFDGQDIVVVNHADLPIVFNGGNHDDLMSLTSSNLVQVTAQTTFNGGNGNDTGEMRDPLNPSNTTYNFSGNSFDRGDFGKLKWDAAVENLHLETGTGGNAIYVNMLSNNTNITIDSYGSDACYVDMKGTTGSVNFYAGTDFDSLQVTDYNYPDPATYTIGAGAISRPAARSTTSASIH